VSEPKHEAPRVIAVASGKGGAGKSLLAANVGIFLATLGKRVVLLDAAFGSANLHTFVGVPEPRRTLADMLQSRGIGLDQVIVPTPVGNLGLVAGRSDPAWAANPKSSQLTRLRAQIQKLDVDYVVLDLGAGTGGVVLDLFLLADSGILVLSPEPPSVELGYRFFRAAFARRLGKISLADAVRMDDDEMRAFPGGIQGPLDYYRLAVARENEQAAERIKSEILALRPQVLVNNVRAKSDLEVGRALSCAARRVLGLPIKFLGHLEYDDAVWVSLRRGRPLLIDHPESRVAKCVERVTRGLLSRESEPIVADIVSGDSHYDLFEIEPTASDEEIRRANRRARQIYGRDSIVVRGLYTRERLEELHQRFDEAYDTLMDPARRKAYDQELFPDGIPRRSPAPPRAPPKPARPPAELPPMPSIDESTEFTGSLMQQVREARGLDLREISERTKIGMGYLLAIESEAFKTLPAAVYVRGFLTEYAKMLELDVTRVLETYPFFRR
jgi:flagellar biosynthesis protein FlhG